MDWDSITGSFCESIVFGAPEYANAISSLFLSFMGVLGLYISSSTSLLIRNIYGLLIVNGIGSFGYHWTLKWGWGLIDRVSMIIPVCLGISLLYDEIIYYKLTGNNNNNETQRKYILYSGVITTISTGYMAIALSFGGTSDGSDLFTILFSIPTVLLIPGIFLIPYYSHKELYINNKTFRKHYNYMYISLAVNLISAIIWLSTELNCSKEKYWIAYLYGHVFWHIGMGYGMYLMSTIFVYTHALTKNKNPVFINNTWFYYIFPKVEYKIKLLPQWNTICNEDNS
jgi:hypothetical protein